MSGRGDAEATQARVCLVGECGFDLHRMGAVTKRVCSDGHRVGVEQVVLGQLFEERNQLLPG